MNGIKPNVAQMDEEIKKETEKLCNNIADQCSEKILGEIENCLSKMDEDIERLSNSVKDADKVLSKASEIGDTVDKSAASAQELIRSSEIVKQQIADLCAGIANGIAKTKEMLEQSDVAKAGVLEISQQYTERVSTELEALKGYASVWNLRIDTIAQEYVKKIDDLSAECSRVNDDIDLQSKTLCQTILDVNNSLVSLVKKCTDELQRVQSEYEQLLAEFRQSCVEAQDCTNSYVRLLQASEEKIASLFIEFQTNKDKLDDIMMSFMQVANSQNDRFEAMDKAAKTRFIITTSLLAAGVLVHLILHFI